MNFGRLRAWRGTGALLGAALLILGAGWAAASAPSPSVISSLGILALVVLRAGAGLQSLSAANRLAGRDTGHAWRFLATAWMLAALSAVLQWAAWALRGEPLEVPSVVDLLMLAATSCALWAVAIYGAGPKERFGRLRSWLDVTILFLSVLGLSWLILLQPLLETGIASPVQAFWAFVWPALDLVFLALVLRLLLLAVRGQERRTVGLLGLAGVAALVGNLGVGFAAITGDPVPAWRAEVLWMVSALLAALAAFRAGRDLPAIDGIPVQARGASQATALLPIGFTYVVVGYVGVDAWLQGSVDPLGLGIAIALTLLLFARQGVVAGQSEMRQYAALVEGAADIAFICQADGGISFGNPSFDRALRRRAGERTPHQLEELLPGDSDVAAILLRAAGSGWQGDVDFRRADGSSFPVRLSLRPVAMERRRPVLAATAVDLTQIVERERLLRSALDDVAGARAELESLNRALEAKVDERTRELQLMVLDLDRLNQELRALDQVKSEFVALVSHELRAPLTNIRTGIELLVESDARLPSTAHESLSLILEETKRLGSFVEAILDLSALEAGRFPLRSEPVDLAESAAEARDRFQPAGARIEVDFPADLPAVAADPRAVASVFHHLFDNAVKYGGDGAVLVTGWSEAESVVVAVTDDGPGIPEAELERVFDRFHRLDSSDSRQVYGHGLGLHLVRRMLEAMGGGIRAELPAGGGARLVFWLPRATASSGL